MEDNIGRFILEDNFYLGLVKVTQLLSNLRCNCNSTQNQNVLQPIAKKSVG